MSRTAAHTLAVGGPLGRRAASTLSPFPATAGAQPPVIPADDGVAPLSFNGSAERDSFEVPLPSASDDSTGVAYLEPSPPTAAYVHGPPPKPSVTRKPRPSTPGVRSSETFDRRARDAVPPPVQPFCAPWTYIPGPMYVAPATDWAGRLILIWRTPDDDAVDQYPPLRDDPPEDQDSGASIQDPPADSVATSEPHVPPVRRAPGPPASSWAHLAIPTFRDVAQNLDFNTAMSSVDATLSRQVTK